MKDRLIPGNSIAIERPLGAESVNERPEATAASQTATAKVLLDRHPHFHGGAGNTSSTPETIWS